MKEIKSLYLAARNSGLSNDINAYREAVNELSTKSPSDYILQLEYIIMSSIGLSTFKEFVDKHGLPIAACNNAISIVEKCIEKSINRKEDYSKYEETKQWLESYRNKYIKAFAMYEYFSDQVPSNYIETYYGTTNGNQNRILLSGMYKKFKEYALPDMIITADLLGENACKVLSNYLEAQLFQPVICEWVRIATHGTKVNSDALYERTLSSVVESMRSRNHQLFRESLIMGNDDAYYEYSQDEIDSIHSLISIKEYCLTWGDEFNESTIKDIYSLYEELDGIQEDVADSVIPMLPGAKSNTIKESWLNNTTDKKTGQAAPYISKNHDMAKYGEEDPPKKDTEPTIDDYRRPSVPKEDTSLFSDEDEVTDTKKLSNEEPSTPAGVNNYYYYNYNNSLNKNTNSFNKDNSRHDNSSHVDDHSTGKMINSNNSSNKEDGNDFHKLESKQPWELDIFGNDYIREGFMDKLKTTGKKMLQKASNAAKKALKTLLKQKTLKNIQNMDLEMIREYKRRVNGSKNESMELITEGSINNLTEEQIRSIINRIGNKYKMNIVVYSNKYLKGMGTGACCTITTKEIVDKIVAGENVSIPNPFEQDQSKLNKYILLDPEYLAEMGVSSEKDMELIILHEYGHYLTLDKLSQKDWIDFRVKLGIMKGLPYDKNGLSFEDNWVALMVYGYHRLKGERLANEQFNIDPKELVYCSLKRYPKGNSLKGFDLEKLVNMDISEEYLNLEEKFVSNMNDNEVAKYEKFRRELYKLIILDSKLHDEAIRRLEEELQHRQEWIDWLNEAAGDADDNKPESDHPIKDVLQDIDRELTKKGQQVKKTVQDISRAGRAAAKPIKRLGGWINNMITKWKDADETNIKERLADPHARSGLFSSIRKAITAGSLLKAGLLLNPIFLFLTVTKKMNKNKNEFRIRNEMIGEIKAEIEICNAKIEDADRMGDNKAKYQLMRFRNELNKKLLRVGGGKDWAKMI